MAALGSVTVSIGEIWVGIVDRGYLILRVD
jgi:hypothetical protein